MSIARRSFVTLLGSAWLPLLASETHGDSSLKTWLIGNWQSDRERTMENFRFQGQIPNAEESDRISKMFGHLRYSITSMSFQVIESDRKRSAEYLVAAETSSTITLRFPRNSDMPDLTLYRLNDDLLFIKAGLNFEYFRRAAAYPST